MACNSLLLRLLPILGALLALGATPQALAQAEDRPNFVVVLVDEMQAELARLLELAG